MDQEEWILSRAEVYYLMKILNADTMIGLGTAKRVAKKTLERGRDSLARRGLIASGDKLDPVLESLVLASFFPDGALVVIRDLPQLGRQILLFFRRGNMLILHTFPKRYFHRLAPIDSLAEAVDLILRWFPLVAYSQSECSFLMAAEQFEALRQEAESERRDAALQMLTAVPLSEEEKRSLIEAIEHRTISGSFAAMRCAQSEITEAHSVAIFAGPATAWLIMQPEGTAQKGQLLIRRIGRGFESVVSGLFQRI